jgi:uncharacterized surface protein with fasciclin (FAS1) repeats
MVFSPSLFFLLLLFFFFLTASLKPSNIVHAFPDDQNPTHSAQINSNSVLVALLESHYTELAELVEKAALLQTLEDLVSRRNVTVFAPVNHALNREFKLFLLEPRNLRSLQTLLLSHIVPKRVSLDAWPTLRDSLAHNRLELTISQASGEKFVGSARVTHPHAVNRPDGVIHGIERFIIPESVQQDFNNRRSLREISAVKPEGAPEIDPRTNRLRKPTPPGKPGSAPVLPIYYAMAPGPSLAPAPAPGPGGPHHHFNGMRQVKDFIDTLLQYGGYNEIADMLVNLTGLATEMGRLVSEGYVLTVLAPNDEAMAKLTTDRLSEPGAPEQILYYHIVQDYQTEESMYNAVRRFGKVKYDTLQLPQQVVAQEADGSVKFGQGEGSAYLFDPDIYTDGRISVQGIDGVLFPVQENKAEDTITVSRVKVVAKPRRGMFTNFAPFFLNLFIFHKWENNVNRNN